LYNNELFQWEIQRYFGSEKHYKTVLSIIIEHSGKAVYAVYIDGMLERLEASNVGCYVGNKFCGVIGYADDVLLLCHLLKMQ